MQDDFYYSKFRLVLCAIVCTLLGLILVSIFSAAITRVEHAWIYAVIFGVIVVYIATSLFTKFLKLLFGNTPAISVLNDRVIFRGVKNKEILYSTLQSVTLTRPSGPDGTVGFYAIQFEFIRRLESGQYKWPPAITIPLPLISVNRIHLLNLIQDRMAAFELNTLANMPVHTDSVPAALRQ